MAALVLAAALPSRGADPVVDLEAADLIDPTSGERVALGTGAKVYHLVFFATWCRDCLDEFGRLSDLEARWGQQEYRLYLVAVPTRQDAKRLAEFVRDQKPPGRVLLDPTGQLTRALDADGIPTHCILDGVGRLVHDAERIEDGVLDAIARTMHRSGAERTP